MINWLNDFLALAETKQFSNAADKIYISQSALSKHIKALENEVGTLLFDRSGAQVELTPAGDIYLEYALKMRELEHELQDKLAANHLLTKAIRITVAAIPCITESGVMKKLLEFEAQYNNLTLECLETDQRNCLKQLGLREIDATICRIDFLAPKEYDFIPLVWDEMVLICQKGALPFEEGTELDLGALDIKDVYTIAKESDIYRLAQLQMQRCGMVETFSGTAHRHRVLLSILSSKGGFALLPQQLESVQLYPNLTYYHLKNAVKTQIGLVRLAKSKSLRKTEALFNYFSCTAH